MELRSVMCAAIIVLAVNFALHEAQSVLPQKVYRANVERIIDADTFVVRVELPLNTLRRITIRLRGIDCPEIRRPANDAHRKHGKLASLFVESLIGSREVQITNPHLAAYNRHEADVRLPDGRDLASVLRSSGYEKKMEY